MNLVSVRKVGYFKSVNIAPAISNDGLNTSEQQQGTLVLPAEVYHSEERKLTILYVRSGVIEGCMRRYGDELTALVKREGFASGTILTSTLSPIHRERDSNRLQHNIQIPEIFAYVNNYIFKQKMPKYYEIYGIKKFGYWLTQKDLKKSHTHQELDELMMAGMAKGLMKTFNRVDIPCTMFVIFTSGGYDFVGGYAYYNFLKTKLFQASEQSSLEQQTSIIEQKLGKLQLKEQTGEEIHKALFDKKEIQIPAYWRHILDYF
eukprot:403352530